MSGQSTQAQNPRKRRRTRNTSISMPAQLPLDLPVKPAQAIAAPEARSHKDKKPKKSLISAPVKRPLIAGQLRKLAVPKPLSIQARKGGSGSTKSDVNRRGNKINKGWGTGGFAGGSDPGVPVDMGEPLNSKDPKQGRDAKSKLKTERKASDGAELWITRKTSYPAYLRSGVAAFIEKG